MAENKFSDKETLARCVPMGRLQSVIGGFLHREVYGEIPPRVEYRLTAFGESFIPVLQTMMEWSEKCLCPDYQNPYAAKSDTPPRAADHQA